MWLCSCSTRCGLLGSQVFLGYRYVLALVEERSRRPPSGELHVRILDVGPINGDSILISSAGGKTVLIDAGDTT